jgi:glycosyltransferase involved in cell wall biosynthesis
MPAKRGPVAIFVPSVRGGGAERAMLIFGQEMIARGFSVDLVTTSLEGALVDSIPKGISVVDLQSSKTVLALPKLVKYLKARRPVAIYATIINANTVAATAAFLANLNIPVIVREATVPISSRKVSIFQWLTFKALPFVYRFADGVIAVSQGVADELAMIMPGLVDRIRVIPTPVVSHDVLRLGDAEVVHPWFVNKTTPVIVSAARLERHKGFCTLVEAFAKLRKTTRARLVILGDGGERERIVERARALGVQSDVDLLGFKKNPFPYMRHADAFVLASEYEGLPNVLVQAMAFGTPIVATDCKSGPAEILCQGRFGSLVPVGDTEALSKALADAIKLPKQVEAMEYARYTYGAQSATEAYLAMAGLV